MHDVALMRTSIIGLEAQKSEAKRNLAESENNFKCRKALRRQRV